MLVEEILWTMFDDITCELNVLLDRLFEDRTVPSKDAGSVCNGVK